MGWYVRRSMKIAPGVRVNFSNRGMGVSVGTRGVHVSRSATGRKSFSAGIPGTGIRYRESLDKKSSPRTSRKSQVQPTEVDSGTIADQPLAIPTDIDTSHLLPNVVTTTLWRVLWWSIAIYAGATGIGGVVTPPYAQAAWVAPAQIAFGFAIAYLLRSSAHRHRMAPGNTVSAATGNNTEPAPESNTPSSS